jgi:hypothetical protein
MLAILFTVPVAGVSAVQLLALVLAGIKYTVFPYIVVAPKIFGLAI